MVLGELEDNEKGKQNENKGQTNEKKIEAEGREEEQVQLGISATLQLEVQLWWNSAQKLKCNSAQKCKWKVQVQLCNSCAACATLQLEVQL